MIATKEKTAENITIPEIRVWCLNKKKRSHFYTFPAFVTATNFIKRRGTEFHTEPYLVVAYQGYEYRFPTPE